MANAITVAGNLTRDPELQKTRTDKPVLSFRIGVQAAGSTQDDSGFFNCQAWGELAENLAATLKKGARVIVTGELRHRSFEVEGKQRSTTEILVADAGPSMLWATALLAKRVREEQPESEPQPVGA